MKKILLIGCAVLFLCACSKQEKVKKVCDMQTNKNTNVNEVITLKAEGDEIYKYTSNIIIDYTGSFTSESGYTKEEANAFLNQQLDSLKKRYNKSGIDFKGEVKDELINATISIDLNKVKSKDLQEVGLLTTSKEGKYSLKETIKGLEAQGGTCK